VNQIFRRAASSKKILIGTSGFSYPEWVEAGIYPAGTKSGQMLGLYQQLFSLVELNYTWYQMVRAEAMERMLGRIEGEGSFFFTVKLTRTMTHEVAENWQEQARRYLQGIKPLQQSGRLLAVLLQFPPSFRRSEPSRRYLAELLDALSDLPLAVEFRHCSWACDPVFEGLHRRRVTLVNVDAPPLPDLFPSLDVVTNPNLFYLRLHGRNTIGWRSSSMQHKFNYDYSPAELQEWTVTKIPNMVNQCHCGVICFNNHVAGQAVRNAQHLQKLLGTKSV
jgi:uncharacterized protein YecE (DUF72 family)